MSVDEITWGRRADLLTSFSLLQKSKPSGSYRDNLLRVEMFLRHETVILGILPRGKFRAGCAPDIDHFLVGSVASREPEEEVYNQCINSSVCHGFRAFISVLSAGNVTSKCRSPFMAFSISLAGMLF